MPLSPATALGGCSWSVHPASLLPLPSSQDGSTGMKGTQLINMSGTCRKWQTSMLPLKLELRRFVHAVNIASTDIILGLDWIGLV